MENTNRIKSRNEIAKEDTWALEDLYSTEAAWEQELATLDEDKKILSSYAGHLSDSAEKLFSFLQYSENTSVKTKKLGNYCMRKADEDTRDAKYQAMTGRFISTVVALEAALSFETPELMAISDELLEEFYTQYPALERYRRSLTNLRRRKKHILSAAEEKILAATGEMAQAPDKIYGMLTDADMKFPDAVDSDGVRHPLSQGTFVACQESSDRVLRKSAYENFYDGFSGIRNTAAGLLDAQNKQLKFYAETRSYESAFAASLDSTDVPTAVYHNLIDAVHKNFDKMHRYVRLRKKLLGVDKLHFYDIYTPLVPDVDNKIPFAQAKQTVYESLAPLGEEYRAILKEGFENRWIDVYQNEGKRSGAYSAGAAVHPYVLLNYTGTLDSQFTLAHEMGHALHSYLSNKYQNPVDASYVIFVAEVASTCNEALLMEYLLGKTADTRERAYLINHFLDQFKGTIYRQTMFAEFELNIGNMVARGETLTADVLCREYRRLNEAYYGPDMVVDDRIALEWARIPHFYYDYYVFQYATGYSAAIALSRRILKEGASAVQDYLNFLSGGCSKSPIELLKGAGVDMTTEEPVNQALALFGELLDEMESLMEEM
ncbi:MAG: oligoendopeptidase F [Oscillospiraceae bacterium]|nr:oligoendopeptidase F [Oscillospiraceae bacterium]